MTRLAVALLLLLTAMSARAAGDAERTRDWLIADLDAAAAAPRDWNRIASLAFPLARYHRRHGDGESGEALARLARRLDEIDTAGLGCGALVDRHLTGRFLIDAGIEAPAVAVARLAACGAEAAVFDTINALILTCRYGTPPPDAGFAARETARLIARQRPDGTFTDGEGRGGYYLTSHAVLALHWCGAGPQAVARGAAKLARHLDDFHRAAFLDGLAESLIFLRWLDHPIPDEARHHALIRANVHPDGGLCLRALPGCRPHWHATSLLLELLDGE